jgi:protein O-GlcNAc transferase
MGASGILAGAIERSRPAALLRSAALAESQGEYAAAIVAYRAALAAAPDLLEACMNLAALLGSLGRFAEALPLCRRAVELAPHLMACHLNLASTLAELRELDTAALSFEHALQLAPADPQLRLDLADCLLLGGRPSEAIPVLRELLQTSPQLIAAHCSLLFALNFRSTKSESLRREHQRFGRLMSALVKAAPRPATIPAAETVPRSRGSRVRIGFVSSDLHSHSVACFLAPLLDHYDRARFHVTCYASGRITDGVSAWMRSRADAWVSCYKVPDEILERRIREDAIDVLIDLSGHTNGGRMALFAAQPARVQLSFLGYPTTTGLTTIGYRISDRWVDPVGAEESVAPLSERVLRLPDSYFCYRPPALAPEVAPAPVLRTGRVTFGSFNALPKISARTLEVWSKVLAALPDSGLLIKAQGLGAQAAQRRLLQRCAQAGIEPGRVEVMEWRGDLRSHLDCYGRVDVALDTFPYNGATTTCEALWMGVPVVSLTGETHASRMGSSILSAAGRADHVCDNVDDFVRICVSLSQPNRLERERASLRGALRSSPLLDETSYTRAFEALVMRSLQES